ncbi:protein of unknown function [Methylocella tundrae]|uniref:Uncharacterized protein n=1 Tax=Methylocella tundrae TaxID=227605 RepID=A0A4U8Z5N3_METTU|nr:protein of unknown function [Methylocella tundrae]
MAICRIETFAIADSAPLAHTLNGRITTLSPSLKTLQPLDNPFGPRLSPMSQGRSVIYVSGPDKGNLERAKGFEPSTPTLRDGAGALIGTLAPKSDQSFAVQGRNLAFAKFALQQVEGRGLPTGRASCPPPPYPPYGGRSIRRRF